MILLGQQAVGKVVLIIPPYGKENGQGTCTWAVGKWKDGKEHGQGTWTWSNGQKDVGEFRGDKHWNTTNYNKNGNILGKWVNGEWIKN